MGPREVELGELRLRLADDGGFRLDGGAMFGVVPKPLWEKKKPADGRNRVSMATHCLLVERGSDLLLIDTGIGDKHDAKFADIFGLEQGARRLPDSIREQGYELGDITHVLLTHLLFDHCGWNTREASGGLVPTFPKARYWICRGEVEHGRSPNARDRASYDPRNWEPLFDAGVVELFDDQAEPVEGVRAI
ncbi:MAG: MBL fold metallo-hydrolase, partial [Holophagales bacterium]|nr:MBL fold metallo-hydrolase [Holophagales bacterium]